MQGLGKYNDCLLIVLNNRLKINNKKGEKMTEQTTFVSFKDSKSPEEKRQYVKEQLALGNTKYKPTPIWYKENEYKIRFDKLEAKMNQMFIQILSKLPK
jgi:hypothetical protein